MRTRVAVQMRVFLILFESRVFLKCEFFCMVILEVLI